MHLTEDFPISSRLIRKTFRDEQKMNPKSARNMWKLLTRTRTRPEPEPDPKNPTRFQLWFVVGVLSTSFTRALVGLIRKNARCH